MIETNQSQSKLDSNQSKYLIINSVVVLDAIVTSEAPTEDDLVIRQLEEKNFSIFKDGKQIADYLDKLISEYEYFIVLYSDGSEHQIIQAFRELNKACKQNGLKEFPKITAMVVKDHEAYPEVRANEPRVAKSPPHGILVASYSMQPQEETEILDGVAKMTRLSKSDYNSHIVIDNRSSFINKAKRKGWNVSDTASIVFKEFLYDLCLKEVAKKNQRLQQIFENHAQEEEKESVQSANFKSKSNSISLIKASKNQSQIYIHSYPLISQNSSFQKEIFVGRESELSQLKEHFHHNTGFVGCVIVGGAGLGKSQLATEYVTKNQKEMYSEVVWLHTAQGDIADQIRTYLEKIDNIHFDSKDNNNNIEMIQKFYQILTKEDHIMNKSSKKSCVVFDDVDRMDQIADYLPEQSYHPNLKIDILVTSRYKKWEYPLDRIIELQKFRIEDTKNYTRTCFFHSGMAQDENSLSKEATRLHRLVDGLPLALSIATSYIMQKEISISYFCDFFGKESCNESKSQQSQKVSEEALASEEDEYDIKTLNVVSTIFALILPDLRVNSCNTESILDILPYLCPNNITITILNEYWMKSDNARILDFDQALAFVLPYLTITATPIYTDQTQFGESKTTLTEDTIEMKIKVHPLILKAIRLAHERSNAYERICQNVFDWIVANLAYDELNMDDINRAGIFVIHGMHLESLQNHICDQKMVRLQEKIGYHQLWGVRNAKIAQKYYAKALVLKEKNYGNEHFETADTLKDLGKAYMDLGNYEQARDLLTRALKIHEKHYGKDHPNTASTLQGLGNVWGKLGGYEEQRDLLTQALIINEKHFGQDHPETGGTLSNIGIAWGNLGNYEKQRDSLTRALQIFEKHYQPDHPYIGAVLTNLGSPLGSLGNYEEQKDSLTRALKIFEKHYNPDHPHIGITLTYLGNAWGSLGKYEKQKNLLIRALEINEKFYGKDHPQTAITLDNLGKAWGQLGEYEKQKDLLIRALEIKQKHFGENHPQTSLTLNNLANAWEGLGEYEKQKDLLIRALEIKEKYYGKDHLNTSMALGNLGRAWGQLGDHQKQVELLNRTLKIFENHYDKDYLQIGITLYNLGDAWGSLGNYEKQKNLLLGALEIFQKHYGEEHPQMINILDDLGNAYEQLGNYEKQKELQDLAIKLREKQDSKVISATKSIQTVLEDVTDMKSTTKAIRSNSEEHISPTLETFKKDSRPSCEIDPSDSTGSHQEDPKHLDRYTQSLAFRHFSVHSLNAQINNGSLDGTYSESNR